MTIIFVTVVCEQCSLMLLLQKRLQLTDSSDAGEHFLAIEYFLIKVYTLMFRHFTDYSTV